MSRLKKGTSEVPAECQQLIDKLRRCTRAELGVELARIDSWTFGKSELYHWIDVLDIFDAILEEATRTLKGIEWLLACDVRHSGDKIRLLLSVLNFTTLLIEHSFSRHLYNSVEHLTYLLSSANMEIVLGVLNLLYMFSKRSNFIPRLNSTKRTALLSRLTYIAEVSFGEGLGSWCSFIWILLLFAELGWQRSWLWSGRLLFEEYETARKCIHILLRVLRQRRSSTVYRSTNAARVRQHQSWRNGVFAV